MADSEDEGSSSSDDSDGDDDLAAVQAALAEDKRVAAATAAARASTSTAEQTGKSQDGIWQYVSFCVTVCDGSCDLYVQTVHVKAQNFGSGTKLVAGLREWSYLVPNTSKFVKLQWGPSSFEVFGVPGANIPPSAEPPRNAENGSGKY